MALGRGSRVGQRFSGRVLHLQTAEQIVWGVIQTGKARTVRGRRQFERGVRDISEEIGVVMRRRAIHLKGNGLYSPAFTDVEINWDHLLENGDELFYQEQRSNTWLGVAFSW
jgi:hypothetical protein